MMTIHQIRHLFSHPLVTAAALTCVTVVAAAQQPAQAPDAAALERQAEINRRPDTPGTVAVRCSPCERFSRWKNPSMIVRTSRQRPALGDGDSIRVGGSGVKRQAGDSK
jgi:hypothetical protein